jgi:hypothetical protein
MYYIIVLGSTEEEFYSDKATRKKWQFESDRSEARDYFPELKLNNQVAERARKWQYDSPYIAKKSLPNEATRFMKLRYVLKLKREITARL